MRAWTRLRSARGVRAIAVATIAVVALAVVASAPALGHGSQLDRVKYYVVALDDSGQPEGLDVIALRFLGSANRAHEIISLNAGRVQPDGGVLANPSSLRAGWLLVLPWDAIGEGIRHGVVPAGGPAPSGTCGTVPVPDPTADRWAQRELALDEAWSAGRGAGVTVAVIDTGVHKGVPQLAGRLDTGIDVLGGSPVGPSGCLGGGTAMAALIAADGGADVVGVAPGARILPIRVADHGAPTPADQASAIDEAVLAKARVIALGSPPHLAAPAVRLAIENAARHDAVIVVPGPLVNDGSLPAQVIRVGALDRNGQLAEPYAADSIDLVAPGLGVASLGVADQGLVLANGTQYAVALMAGVVALVRGADSTLSAETVVRRLRATATPLAASPGAQALSGLRMVSAVRALLLGPPTVGPPPVDSGRGAAGLVVVSAVVLLSALGGMVFLRRRGLLETGRGSRATVGSPQRRDRIDDLP